MTKTGNFRSPRFQKFLISAAGILLGITAWVILPGEIAWSAEIQVTASVDKRELTLEDSVNLSITVEGAVSAPQPQLPPLPSFTIRSRGTSSSIQIINGQKTSSAIYNFVLIPKNTGSFTVGSATVKIDGRQYQTAPITLIVKEPSETVDPARKAFAELWVSNKKPYVHEQITAALRIYHRVEIRNLGIKIHFTGFREEKLKGPVQNTRVVNGMRYRVHEIPAALFPLRSGTIEIPAGMIELDQIDPTSDGRPPGSFDPFGGGSIFNNFGTLKHKILRTKAVTLDVRPLPKKNRPEMFSNLVGDFTISAQLSRAQVEVGDTTTLTVTVAGRGNIKNLALLSPEWGDDFKVYEDQPKYRQDTGMLSISGEKIYTYALVPLKPGEFRVPALPLAYFDPTRAEYVLIQTDALPVSVSPAKDDAEPKVVESGPDNGSGAGRSGQKLGEDILPIHTGAEIYEDQDFSTGSGVLYSLGMILPAGLFLLYASTRRHRQRLKHDIAFSRNHGAFNLALKKLDALSDNQERREIARELSLIVREYLGNILNLQGTAITSTEVEEKLSKGNFGADEIQATQELLEKYEKLQYASTSGDPSEDLIQESRNLLERLEKKS